MFKCTKCGNNIEFSNNFESAEIICPNCGKQYYIQHSKASSFKNNLKTFSLAFGKFAWNLAKAGVATLQNMQSQYDEAENRLYRKGLDEWDEEQIEKTLRCTANSYEQQILRQKLRDLKNTNDE